MPAFSYINLSNPVAVPVHASLTLASATALVTNPAATTKMISGIDFHNTTAAAITLLVLIVPNASGSLGTPTAIPHQMLRQTIQPYDTFSWEPSSPIILIGTNDAIFTLATAAGVNAYPRGTVYA